MGDFIHYYRNIWPRSGDALKTANDSVQEHMYIVQDIHRQGVDANMKRINIHMYVTHIK